MDAPQGGFFLSNAKNPFKKPAISIPDQIALLEKRGLAVDDKKLAEHYLTYIGYYRLSGYWRYFTDVGDPKREKFYSGVTFQKVLDLYTFDRKLRTLLMDALERIEIAFKATVSHEGAMLKGPSWLCDPSNFGHALHGSVLADIDLAIGKDKDKHQHLFINHFYSSYSDERPPCWMVFEAQSFGAVSRTFKASRGEIQTAVAKHFGVHRSVLESWMHSLAFARNVCAHSGRLCNRTFTIKPKMPHTFRAEGAPDRLYAICCIIHHLMKMISDGTKWSDRLKALVAERGECTLESMGFPKDWETNEFWTK